jgi:peptidoglycan/xylan/chitin deacetylase (PgdA/CDA1 family)
MLRMDDVGAASKRYEVYGLTRIPVAGVRLPFPGNWLWFKYLPPFKRWGPYRELAAADWRHILELLASNGARLTVAVTAAWVERDGTLTPFPQKFPEAAKVLREGVEAGLLEVANHGLTHCLLADRAFRPRAFASNRQYHREFYDFVPAELQDTHIARSQEILCDAFRTDVVTFVPPGNLLQPITVEIARRHGLRFLSYRAPTTLGGVLPVIGDDRGVVFHDRDVMLGGMAWLRARLEGSRHREVLLVRELGERLMQEARGRH